MTILVKRFQLYLLNQFIEKNEIFRSNKEASLLVGIIDQSEFTYNLLNIRRVFRFLRVYFLELKLFALYVQ